MMAQKQYRRGRTRILVERGKWGDTVTPLQERTAIRILNTVLVLLCVCDRVGDIALGRLSSHPVENFFGFLRRSVHDVNTFAQMLTATARSTIVKQHWRRLGRVNHLPPNIGNSGVKVSQGEANDPTAIGATCSQRVNIQLNISSDSTPEQIPENDSVGAVLSCPHQYRMTLHSGGNG
jgi:hypothetical protein